MLMRSIIAVIGVCTAVMACGEMRQDAGNERVVRSYRVSDFHEMVIAGPYDVDVRVGSSPAVAARGPERLLDGAVVETKGDTLMIRPRRRGWTSLLLGGDDKEAKFTVTVPKLDSVTVAGSGDLRIDNVRGPSFRAAVAGSGGIDIGSVAVDELNLKISASGDVTVRSGTAQSALYTVAGSGDIDGRGVTVKLLKASLMSSGDVRARATGSAMIHMSGSGDMDVDGGAKCLVDRTGSGDVRCS